MSGPDQVTLQRLQGGTKWHCPGVECRYVSGADLSLDGETRQVYWDGDTVRTSDDEPVTLASVCNCCQAQLQWTSAGERFAAARRRHGPTDPPDSQSGPAGEDS
jgi:hypothetical protein